MKVTFQENMHAHIPVRIPAKKVCIELDDMEAGFLRSLLNKLDGPGESFSANLLKELVKYRFVAHEDRYGDWDERENR